VDAAEGCLPYRGLLAAEARQTARQTSRQDQLSRAKAKKARQPSQIRHQKKNRK